MNKIRTVFFLFLGLYLMTCSGNLPVDEEGISTAEQIYSTKEHALNRLNLPDPGVEADKLLVVKDFPEDGFFEVQIGPVDLQSEGHHFRYPMHIMQMPFDAWVHGFSWDVIDSEGNELPEDLLHHMNVIDPTHREWFSPIARRLMAAGRETGTQELPKIIGVQVQENTPLMIAVMFASPDQQDYNDVSLRLRISYSRDGQRLIDPVSVLPFYLDAAGFIGPKGFSLPAGSTAHSWDGQPITDGNVLGMGGHLHDYGRQITLVNVTESEMLWEVEPRVEDTYHVVSVPTEHFLWQGGIEIDKNHTYKVSTLYYNPKSDSIPHGGMGEIGGVFLPASLKDSVWAADPDNDAYIEDMKFMLSAHGESHSSH